MPRVRSGKPCTCRMDPMELGPRGRALQRGVTEDLHPPGTVSLLCWQSEGPNVGGTQGTAQTEAHARFLVFKCLHQVNEPLKI